MSRNKTVLTFAGVAQVSLLDFIDLIAMPDVVPGAVRRSRHRLRQSRIALPGVVSRRQRPGRWLQQLPNRFSAEKQPSAQDEVVRLSIDFPRKSDFRQTRIARRPALRFIQIRSPENGDEYGRSLIVFDRKFIDRESETLE